MKTFDPNDAPEGYFAAKPTMVCSGCAFFGDEKKCADESANCLADMRNDGCAVIFVKKEQPK